MPCSIWFKFSILFLLLSVGCEFDHKFLRDKSLSPSPSHFDASEWAFFFGYLQGLYDYETTRNMGCWKSLLGTHYLCTCVKGRVKNVINSKLYITQLLSLAINRKKNNLTVFYKSLVLGFFFALLLLFFYSFVIFLLLLLFQFIRWFDLLCSCS